MAVKQQAEVTVTDYSDADHFTTWHRLTTSATAPSAPAWATDAAAIAGEAATASTGWCRTEPQPGFTGATPYLYECVQTVWGDGSCEWGAVQRSASFEAAKTAYNEAQAAKQTATDYITTVTNDGIMVADTGNGASSGSITSGTTGWHIGGVLEFIRQGVSRFWIGLKSQGDTTPTVRIGKDYVSGANDNESHMELDYHSLQLVDLDGDTYFHVSDLRGSDGLYELTEEFTGDGSKTAFVLQFRTSSELVESVTVGGTATSAYTVSGYGLIFSTAPASGAAISITYKTASGEAKAYTLGTRTDGQPVGVMSYAIGSNVAASGTFSSAQGESTVAEGRYSHAEGSDTVAGYAAHSEGYATRATGQMSHAQNMGTKASSANQTAMGKYNVEDTNDQYALIIGNGTADNARSNALTVDWDGNVECGDVNGVDISDSGWQTLPLSSSAEAYSSGQTPKYRKVGPIVSLTGAAKPKSQVASGGSLTIGTLPQGARPYHNMNWLCQGSSNNKWLCSIDDDGVVTASRYSTGGTNAAIPTGAWLVFDVMFMAGE